MLFNDQSAAAGANYGVCLRTTEGGPVVHLGEGVPMGLSADATRALAVIYTPPQLVIYPTGPGEPVRLPKGNLETYRQARWFPDGRRILFAGNEAGKAMRCYSQDLSGGPPLPVTPEGTTDCAVSPDGLRVVYSRVGGPWFIQPLGGETARPVPGLTADDQLIGWSPDGRSLHLIRPGSIPFRFERLDLDSGLRLLVREVAPADRTGVLSSIGAALADDATSYAYDYYRMTSQLFVLEGAR
jgi:hypothetical protein